MLNGGASDASVSRLLSVSRDSVQRHHANGHVAPPSAVAAVAVPVAPRAATPATSVPGEASDASPIDPSTARDEFDFIKAELDTMLAANPSPTQRLAILTEHRRTIEARARVIGPAPSEPVSYADLEGWAEYEAAMFEALEPFPEARTALAEALRKLEGEA
jgi:hypothetical protein